MSRNKRLIALMSALSICAMSAGAAQAQTVNPPPAGVLSLDAQASEDVPADIVTITLFFEQEGNDPAALTRALNQRAADALARAPGNSVVKVSTGTFSVSPATDRDGKISAWRGRTELVLESRDFAAASALAGRLSNLMQVGSVDYSLSPEATQRAQTQLTDRAIRSFRERADAAAKAFGYSSYTIREVNVGQGGAVPRMRTMAYAAKAQSDSLAIQGGTNRVNVTVNGSVQMR
ncbi:SIMPL domain-containing protein [Chitinasiproducens palmae]|uniref:Predicted secreted protein n=1 Tax=Chitinasiproducens palmae TaxID=1770053 RepID=A0A1H2PN17_9BURK|nr:SIMPL domain-containing protein [Chitinasiproducens palmae]SDV48012.1 Predicted secreted protein [Chitinasiproducens palmae]